MLGISRILISNGGFGGKAMVFGSSSFFCNWGLVVFALILLDVRDL